MYVVCVYICIYTAAAVDICQVVANNVSNTLPLESLLDGPFFLAMGAIWGREIEDVVFVLQSSMTP